MTEKKIRNWMRRAYACGEHHLLSDEVLEMLESEDSKQECEPEESDYDDIEE